MIIRRLTNSLSQRMRTYDLIGKPIIELPEDSAVVAVKEIFERICETAKA